MTRVRARVAFGCSVVALVGIGAAWSGGLRINGTASMPRGLWRVTEANGLQAGDVVVLCLPDTPAAGIGRVRGYVAGGGCPGGTEPLVKPVVAVGGDVVAVATRGVSVNGRGLPDTAQLVQDSAGRPLAGVAAGSYRVRTGEVWVISQHAPNSWDSRYWGAVPAASIIGKAQPLAVAP